MVETAGGLLPASRIRRWESPTAGFFAAIACVATATALVYPLRTIAPPVSAGVVYMLGVLVVSTYWGRWLGLFTSVASAVATSPITPKPRRLRTALTSLEARVISSPVECPL